MQKRFVTTLLALVAAIACLVGLVACGGNAEPVAGNTYVFEKAEITKGASGAVKEESEKILNQLYAETSFSFDDENNFTMTAMGFSNSGTYTQSGSKLTMTADGEDQTATVTSDSIKLTITNNGVTATLTYKLAQEETGTITSPSANVAGKTYVFKELAGISRPEAEAVYEGATIAFDNNGGFTMTVMGSSESGTYTQNNATLTMTANDTTLTATVSGDELLLTVADSAGIVFQLQEN